MVPAPGSSFVRKAGWRLGLPYLLHSSGLVCFLLFTFALVLAFCSVEHALEFRFVASSLANVFVSLSYVCLHTLVWICVWAYLILHVFTLWHSSGLRFVLLSFNQFLRLYSILFATVWICLALPLFLNKCVAFFPHMMIFLI